MKCVLQRVIEANCVVDEKLIAKVGHGFLIFTCFEKEDDSTTIDKAIHKIINLRAFDDEDGKMNLSILDVKGEILNISQFTLSWDGRKGHRPSFERSMPAQSANLNFEIMTRKLSQNLKCEKGIFGADMKISLINDGPVTFHLEF